MHLIVKNTTISNLADLLAPHSCRGCGRIGAPLCDRCKNDIFLEHQNLCPNCKSSNPTSSCPKCPNLPPTFIIAERSSIVGDLIRDLKYTSARAYARPLAILADKILPSILGLVAIVPLPTITRHIRERGLDHTHLIAKELAKLRPNFHIAKVLIRTHDSVQVGASESARLSQAKKAYQINPKITIDPNITYLLLDDVWTTGASMKAACKLLKSAGAQKIVILSLTVSQMKH